MSRISRGTAAGDAYLALQGRARRAGRATQELLQLYVLECFLVRLAVSDTRENFVLKGGVLLAAFDTRRPTKDVDLAGVDLANDTRTILGFVRRVLEVAPVDDDGIEFFPDTASAEVIRDEDEYSGVRVHVDARLASAKLAFHVDVNVGDPIWPEPTAVDLPRLLGGEPIHLAGYPIHMVHAEKIVTAVQRGTANTRWRDFGDIWSLSRMHATAADDLGRAIDEVARARKARLSPLVEVLDGFANLSQGRWTGWRRRSSSDHLPAEFEAVLAAVVAFADPVLLGQASGRTWDPNGGVWR